MTAQPFPTTFANLSGGNNPAALIDGNFAVVCRGPSVTVNGNVPYWDNLIGTSLNAGYPTSPALGTLTTLIGIDGSNRLPAVNGSLLTNLTAPPLRGYIGGLTLSNDGTTPNTVLDVSAGIAVDSTNAVTITLGAFTKSTGGAWTSGTGNNGMGNGLTIANSTTYYVFVILNGGLADVYFDTSASAANAPVGTTNFRRIGSFKTDGSAHIRTFIQRGDIFLWMLPTSTTQSAITSGTFTADAPTGITTTLLLNCLGSVGSAGARAVLFFSPDLTAQTANTPAGNDSLSWGAAETQDAGYVEISTSNGTVKVDCGGSTTNVSVATLGWRDRRGQDA